MSVTICRLLNQTHNPETPCIKVGETSHCQKAQLRKYFYFTVAAVSAIGRKTFCAVKLSLPLHHLKA